MNATADLTHIRKNTKSTLARRYLTLCGRWVGQMKLHGPDHATCPKCAAIRITIETAPPFKAYTTTER